MKTRIAVDLFGGDNAPEAPLKGCARAVRELGVEILAAGNSAEIRASAEKCGVSLDGITIIESDSVMPVEEDPTEVLKRYADSSMAAVLKTLAAGECDAAISAGSTGALMVGATMLVKRIRGVKRAALAPVMPSSGGNYLLLDVGANVECRPEMLMQFGIMGAAYMSQVMDVSEPRVGLVNIGTEPTKGRDLQKEAYSLLENAPLNFIGNIEARELSLGGCDVAVTDGFTGNMILKTTEGTAIAFSREIKAMLTASPGRMIAALMLKKGLATFKKTMDYTEHGGALLLGIAKPVVKAHGSSDENAFYNAIRQAEQFARQDVIGRITAALN